MEKQDKQIARFRLYRRITSKFFIAGLLLLLFAYPFEAFFPALVSSLRFNPLNALGLISFAVGFACYRSTDYCPSCHKRFLDSDEYYDPDGDGGVSKKIPWCPFCRTPLEVD